MHFRFLRKHTPSPTWPDLGPLGAAHLPARIRRLTPARPCVTPPRVNRKASRHVQPRTQLRNLPPLSFATTDIQPVCPSGRVQLTPNTYSRGLPLLRVPMSRVRCHPDRGTEAPTLDTSAWQAREQISGSTYSSVHCTHPDSRRGSLRQDSTTRKLLDVIHRRSLA